MKTHKILSLVFFLFPLICLGQTSESEIINRLDIYFNEKVKVDEPGVSVLIVKNKKPIYRKAFGLANVDKNIKANPETVYRIGSITKQFTTVGILKLVEEGKVNFQDPIEKFLPGYPTNGKKITIEHLLTHTSGIKSYTSLVQVMESAETKGRKYGVDEMIDIFKNQPKDFNPGDNYLYNNSGYFLLGAIIERVSGMTWGKYLEKNFFMPLKMENTFTDYPNVSDQAVGYFKRKRYEVADDVSPTAAYSAGAIFSTVDDLWKWNEAIFSYSVVKKELLTKAWEPLTLNDKSKRSYGYGWQLGRIGERKVIGHGGTIDGFQAHAIYVPDADIFVAVLANNIAATPEEYAYRSAYFVMDVLSGPLPLDLTESQRDEYVGVYAVSANETSTISKKGDKLYLQRTGGTKTEIIPCEKDLFRIWNFPTRIKFNRDSKGAIVELIFSGREFLITPARRTDRPLPKERESIALDSTAFDKVAGNYEMAPGIIMNFRRDKMKFLSQITGQGSVEIFAESETKFFLKVVDANLEFMRDGEGKIASVVLYQGGRTFSAKRLDKNFVVEKKERTEVKLDPSRLTQFEGEYELAPQFTITVKKQGDQLFAKATGQESVRIYAESENKFFYRIVDAQLEFLKDDSGNVNQVILFQNGAITPGKKIK
jgi:CubicO group peptidase (beta-lactamase class C family)